MMHGKYIVVDGVRQSGKTTLVESLSKKLIEAGYEVVVVSEPSSTEVSSELRRIIRENPGKCSAITQALLYTAARRQILEELVLPALDAGKIVLSESSVITTAAYQGVGLQDGAVELLPELIFPEGFGSDLGFVLASVSSSKSVSERISAMTRGVDPIVLNAFESSYVHQRFYRNIYPLTIDRSPEDIQEEAWEVVQRLIAE